MKKTQFQETNSKIFGSQCEDHLMVRVLVNTMTTWELKKNRYPNYGEQYSCSKYSETSKIIEKEKSGFLFWEPSPQAAKTNTFKNEKEGFTDKGKISKIKTTWQKSRQI